jgi:hypothetical protein
MLAAVTLGVVAGACGGSGSSHTAAQDATAACQALARSRGQVSSLSLSAGYRITGAANLGVAAAGEDNKKYGNLSQAMKSVQNDVSNNATGTISKDVNSALAACKADKLPSK